MKEYWNQRYGEKEFAYGKEPNDFFKSVIDRVPTGKLLIPAAGQGRDAVYAASIGWEVFAFDYSEVAKKRAMELAKEKGVTFKYENMDASDFDFHKEQFDMVALIYCHLPANIRKTFHPNLHKTLKSGGLLILEGFHKNQLSYQSFGPKELPMLFSEDELIQEFSNLNRIRSMELKVQLSEGPYHDGPAEIVRYVAQKP